MLWPFDYYKPSSQKEISQLLAQWNRADSSVPPAVILAGGSNMVLDMDQGTRRPECVIDIKGSAEQLEIDEGEDSITVGAAVPIARMMRCEEHAADPVWGLIRETGMMLATPSIRNRATIVGNLVNASPAADMAPGMMVLDASLRVESEGNESRDISLPEFFTGVKKNILKPDEWVSHLIIPSHPSSTKTAFMKRQRVRGHDLAIVNAAGACDRERKTLRMAVGSCAVTPLYFNLDELLNADESESDIRTKAAEMIISSIKPISDIRASAEYRKDMALKLVTSILGRIL